MILGPFPMYYFEILKIKLRSLYPGKLGAVCKVNDLQVKVSILSS